MAIRKEEIDARLRRFAETCRRHGLKLTHQRTEIFRELAVSDGHPDAETIYRRVHQRIPAISLDTVYRTLGALEAHGLVRKAEVRSGPARYDANTDRHYHFVCTRCRLVHDLGSEQVNPMPVPGALKAIGTVTACDVNFRGVCLRCARR